MKPFHCILIISLFSALISCNENSKNQRELDALEKLLFGNSKDVSLLPVYADPATGDYEDFAKGKFVFQIDTGKIALIKKYRDELEPMIEARFDSSYSWIYLAAFLRDENAIPLLKKKLLHDHFFYGWEEGDPDKYHTDADEYDLQLEDHNYCFQLMCISAIEYISGKPIEREIALTDSERDSLTAAAKKCFPDSCASLEFTNACESYWLLCKLTGQQPKRYR